MLDDSIWFFIFPYALFALCIIYPPTEFISAGFTLDSLFHRYLGDERIDFVDFHIRRSCLNIFAHSLLPFGFFVILELCVDDAASVFTTVMDGPSLLVKGVFVLSVCIPLAIAGLIGYWASNDWKNHPTVRTLLLYDRNWRRIATVINDEFRRYDKFSVTLGGIRRVIATDSWVIVTGFYHIQLSQQADIRLTVMTVDEHAISHHSESSVQFVNILVENISKPIPPFTLRLKSMDYSDLRAKLQAPITTARDVMIQTSLDEQFVEAFVEHIRVNNPILHMTVADLEALDPCLGCAQVTSNVRLEKRCVDTGVVEIDEDGRTLPHCRQCYCRPMWCVACMGRWFASRQDQRHPERWFQGRSPCPTCRSTFCLLDVSVVEPSVATPGE